MAITRLSAGVLLVAVALACGVSAAEAASTARKCPAKLIRHAALPSETYAVLPTDVPEDVRVTGKFDNSQNRRNTVMGSVDKGTTTKLPVPGQPVQGFSGIKTLRSRTSPNTPTGQFIVLTDNGYGNKFNSYDSLLMFHYITPNFTSKAVRVDRTVFLSDPNKVIPFPIVNEYTKERYLTGADFDPESIQNVGSSIFIGDEFGPYLIEASTTGVVRAVYDITVGGKTYRSPENQLVRLPAAPTASDLTKVSFNVRRSKGFEGMAASRDGKFLYPMLEGAVYDSTTGDYENVAGTYYLRIFKFNVATKSFDPNFNAKYPLEAKTNSLGDFNMIDDRRALVIERDDGEGDPRLGCSVYNAPGSCFKNPALFKRIYLVDMSRLDANGFVKKMYYLDMLDIQDPDRVAISGTIEGVFTFPFVTIEGTDVYTPNSIVVENDNNFPGSQGRVVGKNDNNEFMILDVGNFLTSGC